MDGLLIVDKPSGITSHDVVARVRRILKTRRVGHTGTLDPFATGVMVILVGKATRLAQFLDKDEKEYEALISFGFETDTGDRTGVRSAECGLRSEEIGELIAEANWHELFSEFLGEIEQVPPMYSAKKIAGKKLYEHARKGVEVERQPITVNIRELNVINDASPTPRSALRIRVVCSAGTYIRTLAEDIGKKLGTRAHLAELRRTRTGRFDIAQGITLDELEKLDEPTEHLLPLTDAVSHLPPVTLSDVRAEATRNGLSTRVDETTLANGDALRMLNADGGLLAIGVYDAAENSIRPKVVLV